MDFDFFKAPAGPDAGSAIHDALSATLAKGEAMSTGMIALQRYYAAKAERDQNEHQFNAQMMLRKMLAQQQFDQSQRLEEGRMLRSEISDKRQEVGQLQAAGDRGARLAFDQEKETTRQQEVQAKTTDAQSRSDSLDALLGPIMAQMGVKPGQTKGLTPGDKLAALNLKQRVDQDAKAEQQKQAALAQDSEVDQYVSGLIASGKGVAYDETKMRGIDLMGYTGAGDAQIHALAAERFPGQPEQAKAFEQMARKPLTVRHLGEHWDSLLNNLQQDIASKGGDTSRVQKAVDAVLSRHALEPKDKAMETNRKALESQMGGLLKPRGGAGAGGDAEGRAAEDQALQTKKQDPHGLLRKSAKGPVPVSSLNEDQWIWAEEQSRKDFDRDPAYVMASVGMKDSKGRETQPPDMQKASAIRREFAKRWLISQGIVSADDKAFSENGGAQAPAQGQAKGGDAPLTIEALKELLRSEMGGG